MMMELMNEPEIPPGYPAELEDSLTLRDGRVAELRPILPSDFDRLVDAIDAADPETLLLRFFTTAPNLSDARIHHLAEVDYESRLALVVLDRDGKGVAVARYEGEAGSDAAEVAVAVDPDWRRLGLATTLLAGLERPAVAHGITRFEALYLPHNHAVAAVFAALGYSDQSIEHGIARVDKKLV